MERSFGGKELVDPLRGVCEELFARDELVGIFPRGAEDEALFYMLG